MEFVYFYRYYYYLIGLLTLVVAPIFGFAVVTKSGPRMSSYKKFVVMVMVSSIISTFTITTTVPFFTYKKMAYEFYGLFKMRGDCYGPTVASIVTVCGTVNTDLFLVILINRFDNVSKTIAPKPRYVFYSIYAVIGITNALACGQLVVLIFQTVLPMELRPFRRIVQKIFYPYTIIYHLSRIAGFVVTVCLNIRFGKLYMANASPKVVRLHRMLTRATIANVICAGLFTQGPMLIGVVAIMKNEGNFIDISVNVMTGLRSFAFFADMVTTLYFVKPFREYVLRLLNNLKDGFCLLR